MSGRLIALAATLAVACGGPPRSPSEPHDYASAYAALHHDAASVAPLVGAGWVGAWAEAASTLPLPDEATLAASNATLPSYLGYDHGGSPLSYVRPLAVLAEHGFVPRAGIRVVDFGSGGHAQLELWAAIGAEPLAIEVEDRVLHRQRLSPQPRATEVRIGRFPAEVSVEPGSVDLWIAKNVLKNGYIHPAPGTDPRAAIDLGVPDSAFVRALHTAMAPGGWVLLYNITPPPNGPGMPYRPWADGRCPFPREQLTEAGFEIVAFERDDTAGTRAMARALRWEDVETFYASYTLLRRPADRASSVDDGPAREDPIR